MFYQKGTIGEDFLFQEHLLPNLNNITLACNVIDLGDTLYPILPLLCVLCENQTHYANVV